MTDRNPLIRRASALLPVTMSVAALGVVLVHLLRYGPAPQPDEGAAAHTWQLLMAAQVPIIGFFAFRSIPDTPRPAAVVLALQIAAAVGAMLPVWVLGW